jgi:hypothetical protein
MRQTLYNLIILILGFGISAATLAQPSRTIAEYPSFAPDKSHSKWCRGDLLLDQPPKLTFSFWSEATCKECEYVGLGSAQVLADDFKLQHDSLATEVVIWGLYFPTNTSPPRWVPAAPELVPAAPELLVFSSLV